MEIKFKEQTTFLGRNGEFKSTGVVLGQVNNGEVLIEPVTSKGAVGRCYVAIPKNELKEVGEALLELAK